MDRLVSQNSAASTESHPSDGGVTVPSLADLQLRQQRFFKWVFFGAVVVLSFAFGLMRGLSKHAPVAEASMFGFGGAEPVLLNVYVPGGVKVVPVGRDVHINGAPGETVSFVTNRDVIPVLEEVVQAWKARGLKTFGVSTKGRGTAMAINPKTRERYTAVAYLVAPQLRRIVSGGNQTQGILTYLAPGAVGAELPPDSVPEIPVIPGAKSGGVFRAQDPGGASVSAFYTVRLDIESAQRLYRTTLLDAGWTERQQDSGSEDAAEHGSFRFVKGDREAIVLLSEPNASPESTMNVGQKEETVAFVVVRQRTVDAPA